MDSLTTLGKTNYIGKDGFHWWIGQVAPPESWRGINAYVSRKGYAQNRCKVRIIGYHPFDEEGNVLPDDDLPWAELMLDPRVGSGQAQLNETSVLAGGEICIGFFLDGEDAQQPVIMGLLPKFDEIPDEISNEEIDTITKWAHKHNFPISTQLIQGLPFETKETFMDTIEYLFQKSN